MALEMLHVFAFVPAGVTPVMVTLVVRKELENCLTFVDTLRRIGATHIRLVLWTPNPNERWARWVWLKPGRREELDP